MALSLSILVALLLVTATVLLHYELLQFAAGLPERLTFPTRSRILVVIAVVLAAHVIEAALRRVPARRPSARAKRVRRRRYCVSSPAPLAPCGRGPRG